MSTEFNDGAYKIVSANHRHTHRPSEASENKTSEQTQQGCAAKEAAHIQFHLRYVVVRDIIASTSEEEAKLKTGERRYREFADIIRRFNSEPLNRKANSSLFLTSSRISMREPSLSSRTPHSALETLNIGDDYMFIPKLNGVLLESDIPCAETYLAMIICIL